MSLYYRYDDEITVSPITAITAAGGITVTHQDMRIIGSGGAINITADPQIAPGKDRQRVMIQGTDDTNTVQFDDGTGLQLEGGVSCVLGKNDTIDLFYDSVESLWIETGRHDN